MPGQYLRSHRILGQHEGATGLGQAAGVRRLLVAQRGAEGDQDRRSAHHRQIRHRRSPRAADHQLRLHQLLGHVVEERADIRGQIQRLIGRADIVLVLVARLVRDLQPRAQLARQMRERLGHMPHDPRALAPAENQQMDRPVFTRRLIRGPGDGADAAAHRVADVQTFDAGRQFGRPGAAGHRVHALREDPVHPAQHAVLLVDQPRHPQHPGRRQRRQRRVAAEARHAGGTVAPHRTDRAEDAQPDLDGRHHLGGHAAARE